MTTRGMGVGEMKQIAQWIKTVSDHIQDVKLPAEKEARLPAVKAFREQIKNDLFYEPLAAEVKTFCQRFPLPIDVK